MSRQHSEIIRDLASALGWMSKGTEVVMATVTTLEPRDFDAPTLLPGWDRRTLVAHLARNADALARLLRWARTGVETPMYSSPQQRVDEIIESARQSPTTLVSDLHASVIRLDLAVGQLRPEQWSYPVRSALGRAITAAEVPWLRAREVWLHAIDLGTTVTLNDFPREFAIALIDDVLATRRSRGELTDVTIATDGHEWPASDTGSHRISIEPAELAGWLTNRVTAGVALSADLPSLGPWI